MSSRFRTRYARRGNKDDTEELLEPGDDWAQDTNEAIAERNSSAKCLGLPILQWDTLILGIMTMFSFAFGICVWANWIPNAPIMTTVLHFTYQASIVTIPSNTSLPTNVTIVTLGHTYDHDLDMYMDLLTGIVFACFAFGTLVTTCYACKVDKTLCGDYAGAETVVRPVVEVVDGVEKTVEKTTEMLMLPSGKHPWVYNHYIAFVTDLFYGAIGWSTLFYIVGYRQYMNLLGTVFISLAIAAVNFMISLYNQALLRSGVVRLSLDNTFSLGAIGLIITIFVMVFWYTTDIMNQYYLANAKHYETTFKNATHILYVILVVNLAFNCTVSIVHLLLALWFRKDFLSGDKPLGYVVTKVIVDAFKHIANYSSIVAFVLYIRWNFHTYI